MADTTRGTSAAMATLASAPPATTLLPPEAATTAPAHRPGRHPARHGSNRHSRRKRRGDCCRHGHSHRICHRACDLHDAKPARQRSNRHPNGDNPSTGAPTQPSAAPVPDPTATPSTGVNTLPPDMETGEGPFSGQDRDMACVCGRAVSAGGTHALVCGALWHTVEARHNMMVDAWRRVFARAGVSTSLESQVK